jgi:ABC-2 type transport system ATP-binding protein
MSVYDYLLFISQLREMSFEAFEKRLEFVISKCGLREVIIQTIQTLSKGYRQRVGIAQAILHDPAFLILDEPTSGLDPNQIMEIRALIRDLGKHKTVILSSHILQEIQAVADRIIIINKGDIVADGMLADLQNKLSEKTAYQLVFEAENPNIDGLLTALNLQLLQQKAEGNTYHLSLESSQGGDSRRDIALYASEQNWLVLEMHRQEMSLEDLFHNLTQVAEHEMSEEIHE